VPASEDRDEQFVQHLTLADHYLRKLGEHALAQFAEGL
jgi:hypothetical protein